MLGALSLDWPADKIKVYILDDGRRPEFKEFAERAGVTHLIRSDNRHAKAGNINAALRKTSGEFVAIFDCDHVPARSFLQLTMGWFLRDPKLAVMQTPHHFFSPDPFERNTRTFGEVPNEGKLFYGVIQDGNDTWNATFFCGSCAVLRRKPLEEVGGVAVETVTEDAHTALKLHRKGYNSAYLSVPQAGGLATDSLAAHVGQRIRWARGMAQILRVDNPLFGAGLKWYQRICYFNAMMHFFFGLPRLIFLTAPLGYLFLDAHVISASAPLIAAYAMPHLVFSTLVNFRVQGQFRHSFWAEIYETSLASYIIPPTFLALINPKLGKFNVTVKGELIGREYFDADIAKPFLILLSLTALGFIVGLGKLFLWNVFERETVLLNLFWSLYNFFILAATVAVCRESRQVRGQHRIRLRLEAAVRDADGHVLAGVTEDISESGARVRLNREEGSKSGLRDGNKVRLLVMDGAFEANFPCIVVGHRKGGRLALQFDDLPIERQKDLIRILYGRASNWLEWDLSYAPQRPWQSWLRLSQLASRGVRQYGAWITARLKRYLPFKLKKKEKSYA